MAKLHILIRDTDEAKKEMALVKASMAEISALDKMVMTLNAAKDSQKTAEDTLDANRSATDLTKDTDVMES